MIEPINEAQRGQVRDETERFIGAAEELLGRQFERIPVAFDLRGTAAGMFKVNRDQRVIRYNPWIFAKYFPENLRDTVPHEVAHYIVHEVHDLRRVKPHGREWRVLMAAFGADPGVTFNLDLDGIPRRRQRTHLYRCLCRSHAVSSTRHNRALAGKGSYRCRYCRAELLYAGA
jgi:SprT protein